MKETEQDIQFLLARADCAGSCSFGGDRWTGMSSNAIVALAYGGKQEAFPSDRADWAACLRTMRRLPRHRLTKSVFAALWKAKEAYLKNYPHERNPIERKAHWERERAEWEQRKRTRRRRHA